MANKQLRGRVELVVGRLGAGKTTWAAKRARELARGSGRTLATTGMGWGSEWVDVPDLDTLVQLRDAVLLMDEIHLWSPSVRGVVNKEYEMALLRTFSMLRKRGICVVGTTQAYTRVSTHVRQLVTSVWWPGMIIPGTLHRVQHTTPPEDGKDLIGGRRWFWPKESKIPTTAEVFLPPSIWAVDDEGQAEERTALTVAPAPPSSRRSVTASTSWGR